MDLVRGKARFVGDIQFPDMLHASFVRSPHAHARIDPIDKRAALELPGVVAVLTSHDIRGIAESDRLHVALPDRNYKQQRDRAILAADETVHVGEAIAMVLATDAYVAEDGAALVDVQFDLLPAVSDCRAALAPGVPPVHRDAADNLAATF